jgi:undecaprenyl diphosphate synthase
MLPDNCLATIDEAERLTEENKQLQLILALSYSGRWEIAKAVRRIIEAGVETVDVNESLISQYLETSDIPDPELLIRTSGEQRISNFLLWQIAYAELFFTNQFWPDFNKEMFFEAIRNYQSRERRFGKTSEQVK